MSDRAAEAQGTHLRIDMADSPSSSSSDSWEVVEEVSQINFRTGSAAVKDVTDLMSTSKEKRMGLPDEGQCTFNCRFTEEPEPGTHLELRAAKADRQKRRFKYVRSTGRAFFFEAYVLSIPEASDVDGVIEGQVTMEITGDVTDLGVQY